MEKVKIPQFVADWIEEKVRVYYNSQYSVCDFLQQLGDYCFEVYDWVYVPGNKQTTKEREMLLVNALEHGYEVEKEPLYYVRFVKDDKAGYLNIRIETKKLFVSDKVYDCYYQTQFTEAEIKAIDERYWAFAVPVEEEA